MYTNYSVSLQSADSSSANSSLKSLWVMRLTDLLEIPSCCDSRPMDLRATVPTGS